MKVAEARIKSAQWELEKLMRRIYGQEPPQLHMSIKFGDVGAKIISLEREPGLQTGRLIDMTGTEANDSVG